MSKLKRMAAGEFKAKCLNVMDEVLRTNTPVIITKRGKDIARLMPAELEPEDFYGCMKESVRIVSDIVAPLDVEWESDG